MDLQKFNFPKVDGVSMVFSAFGTNPELLAEARERGFYHGNTAYNRLFSRLFYEGGKVQFKTGINEDFKNSAWSYLRAFIRSWEPKHEEKEAICALLLSVLVEPELAPAEAEE